MMNQIISKSKYLTAPCRALSIPYWKAKHMPIPSNMLILHQDEYQASQYPQYVGEAYFRMFHDLQNIAVPTLPQGFSLCEATISEYARHINSCYDQIGTTEAELQSYTMRPVYDASLWIAVQEDQNKQIVATGIAELDQEVGEGVLEWIQVSDQYRGKGLGQYVVLELLHRMQEKAIFATVSGDCNNPANPRELYRKCGFQGNDVWHVLYKK